jgi:catechol 2,3-dioxygenase-like lactoylglutathione lyase family enzyme
MSNAPVISESATQAPRANPIDMKVEVVVIPVTDVDRAKRFYQGLGWRLDADFVNGDWRIVQFTPPGSPCSIFVGKGITTAVPGSVQGTFLVVDDLEAARAALIAGGAEVSDAFHFDGGIRVSGTKGRVAGPDPTGRSYSTFASFSDPDGNTWMLQEIKTRLPGRGLSNLDVGSLTDFLREAEKRHGDYAPTAPKHHWSDWYAGYIVARELGKTPEEAVKDAALHMEGVLSRS